MTGRQFALEVAKGRRVTAEYPDGVIWYLCAATSEYKYSHGLFEDVYYSGSEEWTEKRVSMDTLIRDLNYDLAANAKVTVRI